MSNIPKPEYPRPEKQRSSWLNLNGIWDFQLFPEGDELKEKAFSEQRQNYEQSIQVPFTWTCPLSKVEKDVAGIAWYRRSVSFPKQGRVFLCFGAVDYIADVFVNGQHAGHHQGGYTYFELDVTDVWQSGSNLIEVRAEDYRKETQTYGKQGYGEIQGIWQTVWIESRPDAYIDEFRITTKICGKVEIDVKAVNGEGKTVTASFGGVRVSGVVSDGKALLTLNYAEPHLWSTDDPYLYEGTLSLENDSVNDVVSTYFGIREIGTAKINGREYPWLTLNGKPVYINGTLDQAFNPAGFFTYPSEKEIYLEAWRLKRLGLNMVRIHIKPEEPRKLYWMDKLGILVMEDIPCFWGEPNDEARAAYENEWPDIIKRDMNHPATFAWVVFNETWGLFHKEFGRRVYRKETQEWVRSVYRRAKLLDPTRIVEDNSPCNRDHVETDINTWHFYINGYEQVRDHLREVDENTFVGSTYNYADGNQQNGAPLMNSECGLVWGVDKSAGDSDLAWQYHYMLNEYRLHDKICGFVFTEFHDVVNEFNGYYRIDGEDKDFGYQDFCQGMSIRDLHAADMILTDGNPMRDGNAGEKIAVPLYISSFSDALHQQHCKIRYELWHNGFQGRVTDDEGMIDLPALSYGLNKLNELIVKMPNENAAAILSLYLLDEFGKVVSRNFTTFDVHAQLPGNMIDIPVRFGKAEGFSPVWQSMGGEKLCMGGKGMVSYTVKLPEGKTINSITLYLEGSSKRVLAKDRAEIGKGEHDLGFMRGYRVDRGAFDNSYWMTDETRLPSTVEVLVNGQVIDVLQFSNDWADARGMLSWHIQPNHRRLDEAGSFGEQKRITIPSRFIPELQLEGALNFSLRVTGENGLALYGRECGQYAHGILAVIE